MKEKIKEIYTTRDVAKVTGLTTLGVRQAIQRGSLEAAKLGRDYVITRESLDKYLAIRERRGAKE